MYTTFMIRNRTTITEKKETYSRNFPCDNGKKTRNLAGRKSESEKYRE